MAKFSLSIASDDLVVLGFGEPLLLLLRSSLSFKCDLNSELMMSDFGLVQAYQEHRIV